MQIRRSRKRGRRALPGAAAIAAALLSATGALGACTPPPTDDWIPIGQCFDGPGLDFVYDGPQDAASNVHGMSSTDGSCTGDPTGQLTFVRADDQAAADALCATATPATPGAVSVASFPTSPALPADTWQCFSAAS